MDACGWKTHMQSFFWCILLRISAQKQPESYQHFVVWRTDNHIFNSVATDQVLEKTVNIDAKIKGGVVGLTLYKTALPWRLITKHITTEYWEALKSFILKPGQIKTFENQGWLKMSVMFNTSWTFPHYQNPFDLNTVSHELMNIASGHLASKGWL